MQENTAGQGITMEESCEEQRNGVDRSPQEDLLPITPVVRETTRVQESPGRSRRIQKKPFLTDYIT